MDSRQRKRLTVAHRVLEATTSKQFRDDTFASSKDHVFVPALPDDTMGMLFEQLSDADGPIHVAVIKGEQLLIFVMTLEQVSKQAQFDTDAHEYLPIGPEMQVGILLEYLKAFEGRHILVRRSDPKISLSLVDGPRTLCV